MILSFLLLVAAPLIFAIWYLYAIASDQYASQMGFAVRSEQFDSTQGLLGSLTSSLSSNSSSDTDILYEFILSQTMVERVSETIDLEEVWTRPDYDPIFAYYPTGAIEDLLDYWRRMVQVDHGASSGLIEVEVKAFTAEDALAIAEAIRAESSRLINELSAIARADTTRYAREDLEAALARLKTAREALTRFRSETRIVDPTADLQGQMGLLNSLEAQLSEAVIDRNLLLQTGTRGDDPRVTEVGRRIDVITSLIEEERRKFGLGGSTVAEGGEGEGGEDGVRDYSTLVGEFERLTVDREYAEAAYLAAQSGLDTALAEAQRQSRYLGVYVTPALPQSPRYPERAMLSAVIGTILLLAWSIGVLIFYSLRDRR